MQQLVFDIEVFKHDALVVFKDLEHRLIRAHWNTFEGLAEFVEGKQIIAFNGYHYDDYILSRMLMGDTPKELKALNDKIIGNTNFVKFIHPAINSLDAFQQIDVSQPSLKRIEGNRGKAIIESSVPFDIDRPLTEKERDEVFSYCSYDVDQTIDAFKLRGSYYKTKDILLERLGNPRAKRWNTTTISANLLLKKPLPKWAGLRVPEWMMELVPPAVRDLWINRSKNMDAKASSMTITEFDCDIVFGFGGLHGEHRTIKRAENVKLLDVTSMYPSIIIALEVLGSATGLYQGILNERIAVKHTDKDLSDALKLILNSVYGNLKNEYSMLYNPRASLTVCVFGQIALYELCRRLAPFVTIININTDGVAFTSDNDIYKDIWTQWEKDFALGLELKEFKQWIQKDVNNYIAVQPDDKLITKGGDVGRYEYPRYFANNSTRIVDIAIVNDLLYGIDPIDTITSNLDKPEFFQYILQAGGTYRGTFDTEGRQYQKINRVFAVKSGGVVLQKKRMDDGLVRYPDAPDQMMVFNDSLDNINQRNFERSLDLNHYYQLVKKKLGGWV